MMRSNLNSPCLNVPIPRSAAMKIRTEVGHKHVAFRGLLLPMPAAPVAANFGAAHLVFSGLLIPFARGR